MDKKYDMVVHRFRSSGKVDIVRVSLFRLIAKLVAAGLLLVALTAAGSFLIFTRIYPKKVVVMNPLEKVREEAPRPEPATVPPAEPEKVAKAEKEAGVSPVKEAEEEAKPAPEPKEEKPEAPPPDVDIRNFRVIEQEGGILVKLTVNNILEEEVAVSGYVVVVLMTKDGELHTYPRVGLDSDGRPRNPKHGRRFTIRRLIIINADFPIPLEDVEMVKVYSYNQSGKLVLTRDFKDFS